MQTTSLPLIVGAGPVGLGAALFLARQNQPVRIIEMRAAPSVESRALAVNPRTLSILESTGVTAEMLQRGLRIHGVRFYRRGRILGGLNFDGIHPRYPFMLALSQASTERMLERAFNDAGGTVARGMKLVDCRGAGGYVEAVVESTIAGAPGSRETIRSPWMLAADGAHSVARSRMNVDFPGSALDRPWYLMDVPLRTKLPQDFAHVFFLDGGAFVFMIRVVDDTMAGGAALGETAPLWRVMTNRPNPVAVLAYAEGVAGVSPRDRSVAEALPVWQSTFRIAHRVDATLSVGRVFFAGDAAHIHSPLGARGMNLGLEDVWVFAQLFAVGKLDDYDRLRRRVQRSVVRRVEFLSRMASGDSAMFRFIRRFVFPRAIRIDALRAVMLRTVCGLDHELPAIARPEAVTAPGASLHPVG
jgi:2-polyprenyl-6-methoxyphenol hydroxylase-like FAD-dependent oxidoreductase